MGCANSCNLGLSQLTNTIEKRSACQLIQFSYDLDNKTSFSYPRGYYLYQWVLHTCCAESEADAQSSSPMDPEIYFRVQLGL